MYRVQTSSIMYRFKNQNELFTKKKENSQNFKNSFLNHLSFDDRTFWFLAVDTYLNYTFQKIKCRIHNRIFKKLFKYSQ